MSPSESPVDAGDGSDPSVEVYASDVEANVSEEDPEEEEVEEEEEAEEEAEEEEEEAEGEEVEEEEEEEVADSPVGAHKDHRGFSVHMLLLIFINFYNFKYFCVKLSLLWLDCTKYCMIVFTYVLIWIEFGYFYCWEVSFVCVEKRYILNLFFFF